MIPARDRGDLASKTARHGGRVGLLSCTDGSCELGQGKWRKEPVERSGQVKLVLGEAGRPGALGRGRRRKLRRAL